MQGAYGGLIIVLMYGVGESVFTENYLIAQDGSPILTQTMQNIEVLEEV